MDTDVEVIKPLDKFLHHTAFSGFEDEHNIQTGIMASEKKGQWVKENLSHYNNRHFITEDGTMDLTTNVQTITNYMQSYGLKQDNTFQDFPKLITFYPKDYFCPKNPGTLQLEMTINTHTIHHFSGSWLPIKERIRNRLLSLLGKDIMGVVYCIIRFFRRLKL